MKSFKFVHRKNGYTNCTYTQIYANYFLTIWDLLHVSKLIQYWKLKWSGVSFFVSAGSTRERSSVRILSQSSANNHVSESWPTGNYAATEVADGSASHWGRTMKPEKNANTNLFSKRYPYTTNNFIILNHRLSISSEEMLVNRNISFTSCFWFNNDWCSRCHPYWIQITNWRCSHYITGNRLNQF